MPLYDTCYDLPTHMQSAKNDGAEKKSQKGRKKIW